MTLMLTLRPWKETMKWHRSLNIECGLIYYFGIFKEEIDSLDVVS